MSYINSRLPSSRGRTAPAHLIAHWRELPHAVDATAAFAAVYAASPAAFWLDSAKTSDESSRWSFMGDASGPLAGILSFSAASRQLTATGACAPAADVDDIFTYLETSRSGAPDAAPPCPFAGGHVGWFGYELRGECCDQAVTHFATTPDAFFIRVDRYIAIDHRDWRTYVVALAGPSGGGEAGRWVEATTERIRNIVPLPQPLAGSRLDPLVFQLNRNRAGYLDDIKQALEWIGEGQTYQVCLTNELTCKLDIDPFDLYRTLRHVNPAPFAAFMRWPGGAVLSASPERFLSVDAQGRAEAKPIKGTIRRDPLPEVDLALSYGLSISEKDRSENLMIVDLLRNDLSRVCEVGSVWVPKLWAVESFATVHQLVSTVQGQLRPEFSSIDLVKAAFPGGSMTGAPKIHTLALIDRLERRARGVYSGALGWIGDDGAVDLNIVIRTIVVENGRLSIGIGGGIVADSRPEGEFAEMLLKARALVQAIALTVTGSADESRYHIEGI
jgi:para-aminobenzoate synthetase